MNTTSDCAVLMQCPGNDGDIQAKTLHVPKEHPNISLLAPLEGELFIDINSALTQSAVALC